MKRRAALCLLTAGLPSLGSAVGPSTSLAHAALTVSGRVKGASSAPMEADELLWQHPDRPIELRFPHDHFSHPQMRNEWWYFTGKLRSAAGRDFGFQVTFFRLGVRPLAQRKKLNEFLVNSLPLVHFAISDPKNRRLHAESKFGRGAFGKAGFPSYEQSLETEDGLICWMDNWKLGLKAQGSGAASDAFTLQCPGKDQALELELVAERSDKPWTLHGDRAWSIKSLGGAQSSYYYSCTRLSAGGKLRLGDEKFEVTGRAWMDREWSSGLLDPVLRGWDWFSLHLEDGRDLMLFTLRDQENRPAPGGHGTLVEADGTSRTLSYAEFFLTPIEYWRSPTTSTRYPVRWQVEIPNERIQLFVSARFAAQEVNLPPAVYWEGMVDARGAVNGSGYLEMTGYADSDELLQNLRA